MSSQKILQSFLREQFRSAIEFAAESELIDVVPLDPGRVVAHFRCTGLVKQPSGEIAPSHESVVGYSFDQRYLRDPDPFRVLTWLSPVNAFHPNVNAPWICIGPIQPGTGLVELLYRTAELITYQIANPQERDALNSEACAWARRNQHRFPIDSRPLKYVAKAS